MTSLKREKRIMRRARVRAKVFGTSERPRAAIFRSLKHTYVQFIDDERGVTLLSKDDRMLGETKGKTRKERARLVGKGAGEALKEKGIKQVAFDRGGFTYHGRVREVAEGLREAGITV